MSAAPGVAPLTGLHVAKVAAQPALVVKIENSSAARPQVGLDRADLVVEELVEGGITRFAAMFQSRRAASVGTVGPVRSLRDVDAAIAGPTRGLLASSGGAAVVLRRLRKAPVQLVLPSRSAYFRSKSRPAPHNLYARADRLWAAADRAHRAPPPPYLPWAADAATASTSGAGSRPASRLLLTFSRAAHPRWAYDAGSRRWLRSEGGTPSKVVSGARLAAQNVVVLRVRTRDAGYRDPVGNPVPETVLTGTGSALVLSGGRQVAGRWSKASPYAPLTLTTSSGAPLTVAPGTTWLELVPTSGGAGVQVR
ncbi:hypothetical protein ASD06_08645 [Angustibacter sp. Root456]|nr:hypothetical protein ASD06_08645 [Angustibacter sp. Root456]